MTFMLVGFIADLNGSDGHIFEAAPVVEAAGRRFAAASLDWDPTGLVEVEATVAPAFHPVSVPVPINPGETVWVGGRVFVEGIKGCAFADEDAYEIGGWQSGIRGFRTSTGTRRAFAQLVQRLRYKLEHALHVTLFDSLELFSGDGPTLYALYTALPVEPDLQYQLTRALYFDRKRNDYSLEFVRAETVYALGLIDSVEAFEVELRRLETKLARTRLGERTTIPIAAPNVLNALLTMQRGEAFVERWFEAHGKATVIDLTVMREGERL